MLMSVGMRAMFIKNFISTSYQLVAKFYLNRVKINFHSSSIHPCQTIISTQLISIFYTVYNNCFVWIVIFSLSITPYVYSVNYLNKNDKTSVIFINLGRFLIWWTTEIYYKKWRHVELGCSPTLRWSKSFLISHSKSVQIENHLVIRSSIQVGVPRGSVISTANAFIIFINKLMTF